MFFFEGEKLIMGYDVSVMGIEVLAYMCVDGSSIPWVSSNR
jgi:hypothetical protein